MKANKELVAVTRTEELAGEIRQLASRVARDVVEIGGRLIEARKYLKAEGKWMEWLKDEFDWTQQTASNFIRAAEVTAKHPGLLELGSPSILYLLSDPSDETVDRLLKAKSYADAREIALAETWGKRTRAKIGALQAVDYAEVRRRGDLRTWDLAQQTVNRILAEMDQAMKTEARPIAVSIFHEHGSWLAKLTETDPVENLTHAGVTLRERHGEPASGRVKAKLYEEDHLTRLKVWCPGPYDVVLFPRTGNAQADAWRVTFMEACLAATGDTQD